MEETLPKVLNKRLKQEDGIYIGRPSVWGNPYEIGRDGTREQVIEKYKDYLYSNASLMYQAQTDLKGKNLVCWCAPLACHGDVLLKIANEVTF